MRLGALRPGRFVRRCGDRGTALIHGPPRRWSWFAIVAVLGVGAALLVYETRGTLFWADEWSWILTRRGGGLDTFLAPHNQHFSLVPVMLYKLLFATVGLRHYWPYRGLLIATGVICALLIFVYARRRVGGFYAVLAAALIMFFGPGWQDILWPFQTAWILSAVGGIGALLALDRRDRAGDIGACVLLGLSLASTSAGVAIAVGLTVDVVLTRRRRDLWIVGIPILLYALWWVAYQHTQFDRHSVLLLPRFVFDSAAGTLSALAGLAQIDVSTDTGDYLSWGPPLLAVGLLALIWRLRTQRRVPPRVFALSAILLAFWLLTGVGRAYARIGGLTVKSTGDESRYLYIGAVVIVLLVVEVGRVRAAAQPAVAVGVGVLIAAAILSNLAPLQAASSLLQSQALYAQAELETMNLSRAIVAPGYVSQGFIFGTVTARPWFAAERALGSPPLSVALLTELPEFARQAADSQLISIQHLALVAAGASTSDGASPPTMDAAGSGTVSAAGGCLRFVPSPYTPSGVVNDVAVTVPAGGLVVRDGNAYATVSLRRFGAQFIPLGTISSGSSATLGIKRDQASQPWHALIVAPGPFAVCSRG